MPSGLGPVPAELVPKKPWRRSGHAGAAGLPSAYSTAKPGLPANGTRPATPSALAVAIGVTRCRTTTPGGAE
jgi:hypothetical protein